MRPPRPLRPRPTPDRPYFHPDRCSHGESHACALEECMKWKTDHGEAAQMAQDECMQDCNCGE